MGTWDDGIYDNDGALDTLAALVAIRDEERDAARLVARIGLLAWLNPVSVTHDDGDLSGRLEALDGGLEGLPAETRAALKALLDDPEAATEKGSRTREAEAAIGGYSDGPRLDALLRFPGAQPVIDELGERAAQRLDRALAADIDLYQVADDMAALGVVIELARAGLWSPAPARLDAWRARFDAIDKATKSERGFWWKYVRRVRRGFNLIGPAPSTPAPSTRAPAKPKARRAAAKPTGPVRRFTHPKFGAATLVARSGSGDSEMIELRFDDGVVRKFLARFVTEVEG